MEELRALVRQHRFYRNKARTNLCREDEVIRVGPHRAWLKKGVLSNTVRGDRVLPEPQRRMLELVRQMIGEQVQELCLNKNVCCPPHRDKKNSSDSFIIFFDGERPFSGGALHLEDGRCFSEKDVWHGPFNGGELTHWNDEISGDKLSVVAYARGGF